MASETTHALLEALVEPATRPCESMSLTLLPGSNCSKRSVHLVHLLQLEPG